MLLDAPADLLAPAPRGAAEVELGSLLDMAGVRVSRRLHTAGCVLDVTTVPAPVAVEGDMRGLLRLLTALLLRSADIAGPGGRLGLELIADPAPQLRLTVHSADAEARPRLAALAATLSGSAQIHVSDAALARVIAAHGLRLEALPPEGGCGLLLCWPA